MLNFSNFATRMPSLLALTIILCAASISIGPGWSWDVFPDPVTQGTDVTITVDVAPCWPVELEFTVNNVVVGTATLQNPGDSATFGVPIGSGGATWEAAVSSCKGSASLSGTVAP